MITRSARQDAYKQELDAYELYVEQEIQNIRRNAAPERTPGTALGQQTSQRNTDNSQSTGNRDRGDILSQNLLRDALELRTALAQIAGFEEIVMPGV